MTTDKLSETTMDMCHVPHEAKLRSSLSMCRVATAASLEEFKSVGVVLYMSIHQEHSGGHKDVDVR